MVRGECHLLVDTAAGPLSSLTSWLYMKLSHITRTPLESDSTQDDYESRATGNYKAYVPMRSIFK